MRRFTFNVERHDGRLVVLTVKGHSLLSAQRFIVEILKYRSATILKCHDAKRYAPGPRKTTSV